MTSLQRDRDRPGAWVLMAGGLRQSFVDLADPTHLELPYTQHVADAVDTGFPAPRPLRAVHVGGGGMTLPRWLAATRPGSTSLVLEPDAAVAEAAASLGEVAGVELRVVDGRTGLLGVVGRSQDLVVGDAFCGRVVPAELLEGKHVEQVARVLRADGVYVLNLIDDPPFARTRAALGPVLGHWPQVGLVADPSLVAGHHGGNVIVVAGTAIDWAELARRTARRPGPLIVLDPAATESWYC